MGGGHLSNTKPIEQVIHGNNIEYVVYADRGWKVDQVYVNNQKAILQNGKIAINNVNEDVKILVVFKENGNDLAKYILFVLSIVFIVANYILLQQKNKRF